MWAWFAVFPWAWLRLEAARVKPPAVAGPSDVPDRWRSSCLRRAVVADLVSASGQGVPLVTAGRTLRRLRRTPREASPRYWTRWPSSGRRPRLLLRPRRRRLTTEEPDHVYSRRASVCVLWARLGAVHRHSSALQSI